MIQALAGSTVDSVLYAAGVIEDNSQHAYEQHILDQTRHRYPQAEVRWERKSDGDI
jgi:hypothetical protein